MSADCERPVLSAHLTVSVGWIGAVVAYLGLGVAAVNVADAQTIRSAWIATEVIGWFVIVPLAVASLLSGVVMALGTSWGLFRHYWVVISFVLTLFSTAVLILHMPAVNSTVDVALRSDSQPLQQLGGDLFHPTIGLIILMVVQVLNLYKPKGLTRYGWRKQQLVTPSESVT